MIDHLINRETIIKSLRGELVGPFPQGEELDISKLPVRFKKSDLWYGPWRQIGTGEEILVRDTPTKRYGIGVLYPYGTSADTNVAESGPDVIGLIGQSQKDEQENVLSEPNEIEVVETKIEKAREKVSRLRGETNHNDLDLSLANSYNPSSMGVSFLAEITETASLIIEVSGGRYTKIPVEVGTSQFTWWARSAVSIRAIYEASSLLTSEKKTVAPDTIEQVSAEGLNLCIEVYTRPFRDGKRLITVCLVNRADSDSSNEFCLFQSHFKAMFSSADGAKLILPYPSVDIDTRKVSDEEMSLALLYRNRPTFAVGHGCSADWETDVQAGKVSWISAECLPTYETPSMTPDITDKENKAINVPMALLAGLFKGENGYSTLEKIIELYEDWIAEREFEISNLKLEYRDIAKKHVQVSTSQL